MRTENAQMMSRIRTTIETAFFGNNVIKIHSIQQAYELAKKLSRDYSNGYASS